MIKRNSVREGRAGCWVEGQRHPNSRTGVPQVDLIRKSILPCSETERFITFTCKCRLSASFRTGLAWKEDANFCETEISVPRRRYILQRTLGVTKFIWETVVVDLVKIWR